MIAAKVDIVIVNWNAGALLAACLDSLAAADLSHVSKVIVVDNGSTDGSADVTSARLPLTVVRAGRNLGFGRACNLGAAQGDAEFVLLLNPDTEVDADAITRVVSFLRDPAQQDVGAVGIRLVDRSGRAQRHCARFPSWRTFLAESFGLAHLLPGRFRPVLMLEFDHLETRDVDHVMGAFYCVRRAAFEVLGGFDESYFVYFEDLDLSRRLVDAGHRIRYLSEPAAYHRQGGTSDQIRARRLHYSLEGKLLYASKHFSSAGAVAAWAGVLLIEPVTRTFFTLKRRSIAELLATWQGFAMLYRALPTILRSRRAARSRS